MEARLSTTFLGHRWTAAAGAGAGAGGGRRLFGKQFNTRLFFPLRPHPSLPVSCKTRQRHFSLQNKRQRHKKISLERPTNTDIRSTSVEGDPENALDDSLPVSNEETIAEGNIVAVTEAESPDVKEANSLPISKEEITSEGNDILTEAGSFGEKGANSVPISNEETKAEGSNDNMTDGESFDEKEVNSIPISNEETKAEGSIDTMTEAESSDEERANSMVLLDEIKSLSVDANGEKASIQLQDLVGMIRNAEKNIYILNKARIHALEDLGKIIGEKEALQGEINALEMKLAETDARLRVAAQEKIHMELLEEQLEKLKNELSSRGISEGDVHNSIPISQDTVVYSISEELDILRKENASLKGDLQSLKTELSNVKETGERILVLEKERSFLDSSLKELESKLAASQEDVSKLSALKSECKGLYDKVDHLHELLHKATKQADQATSVLQQNQELRKKVERLEESLEEANVYKLSSENLHQHNELMQEKIKLLDECLQRSDEEIQSYIQLYQDSVKEFQVTLDNLKEESKKNALDEPVDDMPMEFWSRLLLMIDGWSLEKKIPKDDAMLLRELVWKRDRRLFDEYMLCKEKNENEIISTLLRSLSSSASGRLHIIHIAAEMAPVAKVGGLGDVVTGLGKALQKKGHLVEIVLPKYDCMQYELVSNLRVLDVVVESYFDGQLYENKIWMGTVEGLPVYFIEPHHPGNFFWRGQFYGEHDDFKRFSFFSRAALELVLQAGKRPDIIHCHDWQTAFIAPLYWDLYVPKGLDSARICFTCHNFEYQGTAPASELASCGLDAYHLNRPDRMQDNSSNDRINPVKGAIVFSNIVTTVSPTYAQEVRSAEGGKGLHATINSHAKKFIGILNGIDSDAWNPASDTFLKAQYSASDIEGKTENKEALRRRLGLSSADVRRPLVGCITRLVPQKGVHLIRHAIYRTLELGGQFVLLGSSPLSHIQREFEDISNHFQNHEHARLILKYDESLSRLIFAASDMFIVPSIFEPCGLTQMIAMRYGSIPIARKTGGLNDSVFDVDDNTIPIQFRNGFTFTTADEQGLSNAMERAFNHYKNNSEGWKELIQKDMTIDFSWNSSASQYEELYQMAAARARATSSRI
ncbi:PREDICTED: probable starch synthase 4, chloroplastic/amyloplastic isoform X2 [Ipomoea nil]|uniref:probable starch synthase 4, chloroplastic/amyloplastic isoform X2 n=1 Tax=Ipomoea nil TaxID=35883 RepID=UPI0009019AA6|nr:PREDICTED: probable starch synthase 4, chloroplastic/amyloplastic isoform X2 [Ipomoea nil]